MLTLAGVSTQSLGWDVLDPPFDVVDRFGVRLVDVAAGEWWRLLTATFVSHFGWPHALLNVAGMVLVARPLERDHGTRSVTAVFVASAAAAFAAGVWGHGANWLSAGGSGCVLGCAGFLVTRWRGAAMDAKAGVALVAAVTFGVPLVAVALGLPARGSVPAHVGGFVAGAVLGVATVASKRAVAAAAVGTAAAVSLLPVAIPLLPGPADLVACGGNEVSAMGSQPQTRLLFSNPTGRDLTVRWISPRGELGRSYVFTADRRGRMPWYGYVGAVYEVADPAGTCIIRVRATRATSTVVLPSVDSQRRRQPD